MSDTDPQGTDPGATPPPPAEGTQPYGTGPTQPYGTQPYGTAPTQPYGAPPAQPYGTPSAQPYGVQSQPPYGAPNPYASAPGYGQAPAYGAYGYPAAPKTNTLAIVSLVASLSAFVILPVIGSIVGVITGHMALGQLKTSGEGGRGLALAGTIVGWVSLGLGILFLLLIFGVFLPLAVWNSTAYGG